MTKRKPRCKALVSGVRCHRVGAVEHIDTLGNFSTLQTWKVRHRYVLCRACSQVRDAITLQMQRGEPVSTGEP